VTFVYDANGLIFSIVSDCINRIRYFMKSGLRANRIPILRYERYVINDNIKDKRERVLTHYFMTKLITRDNH